MLTISQSGRAFACGMSEELEHILGDVGSAGKLGTCMHKYLKDCREMGTELALALVDDEYSDLFAEIPVEELPAGKPEAFAAEVAFAWDWKTHQGRELHRKGDRDYSMCTKTEIPGTADVVGMTDDAVIISDYKSGWAELGRPSDSWQLKGLAVAAAAAYGKKKAIIGFIKLNDAGKPRPFTESLSEEDMFFIANEMAANLEELESKKNAKLFEGAHCKYCPAFVNCPAKVKLAIAVSKGDKDGLDSSPVLTKENIPAIISRLEAITMVVDRVWNDLEKFVEREGVVDLPDGQKYGPHPTPSEKILPHEAYAILESKYSKALADAAIEYKITKKNLKIALKKVVVPTREKKTLAPVEREAYAYLHDGGAMKVTISYPIKKYTPNEKLEESVEGTS